MATHTLKDYLDRERVRYQTIPHAPAYTAQETAQSAHVRSDHVAKTVMVRLDGKLAMAVVPASHKLDLEKLAHAAGREAGLARESEFEARFPDCEPGAMPPFGTLYGLEVFVDNGIAFDDWIAFNAGSHTELVRIAYRDFDRLVRPVVAELTRHAGGEARHGKLKLTAAAVAVLDVFAQSGQDSCSAGDLRGLLRLGAREIDEGIEELERHELLRTAYATPEDSGYELTAAGREYLSTRVHVSGL